jgi:hypothetical protein
MKILVYFSLFYLVFSCAVRQPFTADIKKEYELNSPDAMKKVQFYTSATIVLERVVTNGGKGKTDDGTLVTAKHKEENRIIIPAVTKCIFESFDPNGDINIRFETGAGRVIKFGVRDSQSNGRYYFIAKWDYDKGAEVSYGNEIYYATSNSANACLLVSIKKLQKTRRKDRVVKGLKV